MQTSLTRAILEHLSILGEGMIDAFFPPRYPGTGPVRRLFGLDHIAYRSHAAARQSLSAILSRLRAQGLVQRTGTTRRAHWSLTKSGRLRVLAMRRRTLPDRPLPRDGILRLVSFDIPERERKNRRWLRNELISFGFTPLHKSVFIGMRPLADKFIRELDFRKLHHYVHIIRIEQKGALALKSE